MLVFLRKGKCFSAYKAENMTVNLRSDYFFGMVSGIDRKIEIRLKNPKPN